MMNKEIERLLTSIQTLKQIFNDLGLNADIEMEYEDGSKETINVYETIEKQIVKDINSHDCQLTVEEIEKIIYLYKNELSYLGDNAYRHKLAGNLKMYQEHELEIEKLNKTIDKLQKQKEMLRNEKVID